MLSFSFGSLGEGKGLARGMVLTSVSSLQLKQAAASAVFSSLLNPKEDSTYMRGSDVAENKQKKAA